MAYVIAALVGAVAFALGLFGIRRLKSAPSEVQVEAANSRTKELRDEKAAEVRDEAAHTNLGDIVDELNRRARKRPKKGEPT